MQMFIFLDSGDLKGNIKNTVGHLYWLLKRYLTATFFHHQPPNMQHCFFLKIFRMHFGETNHMTFFFYFGLGKSNFYLRRRYIDSPFLWDRIFRQWAYSSFCKNGRKKINFFPRIYFQNCYLFEEIERYSASH